MLQAQIFSYQCSPLATADGVESVFKQCASYQKDVNLNQHVAVAVFDEIGLAEDSPQLPLKVNKSLEGRIIILKFLHSIGFARVA